jgi:hypothetical protein
MTTVVINTKSEEAKKMVEFLRKTKFARVLDDVSSNKTTKKAIEEAEKGNVKVYKSVNELISVKSY